MCHARVLMGWGGGGGGFYLNQKQCFVTNYYGILLEMTLFNFFFRKNLFETLQEGSRLFLIFDPAPSDGPPKGKNCRTVTVCSYY